MNIVKNCKIACPNCGQKTDIEVDCSVEDQTYVEECHICSRMMNMTVNVDPDGIVQCYVDEEE